MNSIGHLKLGRTGTINQLPVKRDITQIENKLTGVVNRNLAAFSTASASRTSVPAIKKPLNLIFPKSAPDLPSQGMLPQQSSWAKRLVLSGIITAASSGAAIGLAIYANHRCLGPITPPPKTVTISPGLAGCLAIGSSSIIASDVLRFLLSKKYPRMARVGPGVYRPLTPAEARKHRIFYFVPRILEILFKK